MSEEEGQQYDHIIERVDGKVIICKHCLIYYKYRDNHPCIKHRARKGQGHEFEECGNTNHRHVEEEREAEAAKAKI